MKTKFEVWMLAEHDLCDSVNGGSLFGSAETETWEEACFEVMSAQPNIDGYWHPDEPTVFWGQTLVPTKRQAFEYINPEHPSYPEEFRG